MSLNIFKPAQNHLDDDFDPIVSSSSLPDTTSKLDKEANSESNNLEVPLCDTDSASELHPMKKKPGNFVWTSVCSSMFKQKWDLDIDGTKLFNINCKAENWV